ncbi:hypothetical protein P8C59_005948 [Phyllachora maydis]|uniref:Major facilitator superfamily (MFS) profile domain-containing protein n=1 Tax=Phyllachora maydis TaxID=1825666 RepID=A0AAD9I5V0_9PEZI|nr:hypothetical protein P8C59_005948 [Phyllachora maydis]
MACLPPSDDGHPALRGTLLAAAITSVCSAGFLLLGFDQGAMSGVVLSPAWRDTMGVPSDLAIGTLTALFTVGAVLGALFSAVHAETLGRKGTLFLGALLVLKGAVMQAASTGQIIFGLGRVTAGLGIGQVTAVAPVYQSETAGSGQRGWRIACQLTAMLVKRSGACR